MKKDNFGLDDSRNLTIWDRPSGEPFDSQYGKVTYLQWCEKEVERINGLGGGAAIVRKNGLCAVAKI